MKNIITWFSTYQEKMKKRTLRIHRNIEAARLRRARRKRGLAYTYCKNCGTKLKTRVRDKDCVKNRVKRAKIVRFTLC